MIWFSLTLRSHSVLLIMIYYYINYSCIIYQSLVSNGTIPILHLGHYFLLYIYQWSPTLYKKQYDMYADDTIHMNGNYVTEIESDLRVILNVFQNSVETTIWLNLRKTTWMLLLSHHKLTLPDSLSIHINDISLNHVTLQKWSKGVYIDETMS